MKTAAANPLDGLDTCAFEGYEANFVPMGRPAAAVGVPKPSRVFRDDLPAPLPWGAHRALQWLGVALLAALLGLSALFHRGTLSMQAIAQHLGLHA